MSDLQLGLVAVGCLVVLGVIAYNAWNARRVQPRQPQPPPAEKDAAAPMAETERIDPAGFEAPPPPHASVPVRGPLDPLIDVIAHVSVFCTVAGGAAIAHMPASRRAGSKPFAVEGRNEATLRWETPVVGQRYDAFQCGAQLANRSGALNEIEYSEFVTKTQAFAEALDGDADLPDMLEAVARARELDQFASSRDAQLSFTLRARGTAWSPGYVQQSAARVGFVAGVIPGRMVLPAGIDGVPPILSLAYDTQAAMSENPSQSALREFSLSLDVAQVPRSVQPFVRLRESAIALAASMDGLITDDNAVVLLPDALDLIGSELEQLYDALDEHSLSAGSLLARRLFS